MNSVFLDFLDFCFQFSGMAPEVTYQSFFNYVTDWYKSSNNQPKM